jgi:magnesium transporter
MSPTSYEAWPTHLREALAAGERAPVEALLAQAHPQDLAETFPDLSAEGQGVVLDILDDAAVAELLAELEPDDQQRVLELLPVERATDIIEEMFSDDAADLLADLPTDEADALLERMEPDAADDVAELMRYREDTAGGLMAKEFVRVGPEDTVEDALALLRTESGEAEFIYHLYMLDEEERLLGLVTLRRLIISDPSTSLADIMAREVIAVHPDDNQDAVADLVRRHDLLAVPVLDDDGRMVGLVTVDDIGDVVQQEATEDLLEVGGGGETDTAPNAARHWRGWHTGLTAMGGAALVGVMLVASWQAGRHAGATYVWLPLVLLLALLAVGQAALALVRAWEHDIEQREAARIAWREVAVGLAPAALGAAVAAITLGRRAQPDAWPIGFGIFLAVWLAAIIGAMGAWQVLRRAGTLRPLAYTAIAAAGVVVAVGMFLLFTR